MAILVRKSKIHALITECNLEKISDFLKKVKMQSFNVNKPAGTKLW